MPKLSSRLSAVFLRAKLSDGLYPDGDGLYLQVTHGVSGRENRSWLLRYTSPVTGKRRYFGVGDARLVSIALARRLAAEARSAIAGGADPIDVRRGEKRERGRAIARSRTFKQCALAYIAAYEPSWKNAKHRQQWKNTLATYVYPALGERRVEELTTPMIVSVLEPIWSEKPETARRLRQRIEMVLDWATVAELRSGPNPARWRGHLQQLLAPTSKLKQERHFAALPWRDLPNFWLLLMARSAVASLALQFAILTAARTSEVVGATWSEIDEGEKIWIVPAARMKMGKAHKVPLSEQAMMVLRHAKSRNPLGKYVFQRPDADAGLSTGAMDALLDRMGRDDITVHGFRSSFRDWVSETSAGTSEAAEAALAHSVRNKVEAAYRRGDLLAQRSTLMRRWCKFVTQNAAAAGVPSSTFSGSNRKATPAFPDPSHA